MILTKSFIIQRWIEDSLLLFFLIHLLNKSETVLEISLTYSDILTHIGCIFYLNLRQIRAKTTIVHDYLFVPDEL